VRLIIPLGLLCFSCTLLFGQQQTPADTPQTPAPSPPPATATPAPADTNKDEVDGTGWITLMYWLSAGSPELIGGKQSTAATSGAGNLGLPADNKRAPGISIAIPAGKFNRFEVSYFQTNGVGNSTSTQNLELLGQSIPANDYLAINYRVRNYKFTWNYLTWPSPPENSKFRVKTLWEVQYTNISASVDAPFETSALFTPAIGSKHIIFPTFGLGFEYVPTKRFRIEGRGSGFGFPHKAEQWESEINAVGRVGHFEIFAGEKIFHFKTSPNSDNYFEGTLKGPYAGLRFVFW
jgi:hypothetical protein